MLKSFVEELDSNELHYDYISGVSIGAVNGASFALFDFGQEKDAVEFLEDLYMSKLP